ncbi:DUF4864 domain-containing protein [Rhodobacteraceae bacterium M382]|nr:DUF4864 domain-containing protein [Rhodobacteraceae bacterium M382]
MRRFWIPIVFALMLTGTVQAQSADIKAVIGKQIEALEVDDFDRAFSYASPTIQRLFGTPQNFGLMVRQGYPMVWRPADVQFLELRETETGFWQRVMVTDLSGRVHLLDYQMINSGSGWKINAVQRVQAIGASA